MAKSFFHVILLFLHILWVTASFAQDAKTKHLDLPHDGHIRLYVYHTNTFVDLTYLDDKGQWLPRVYDEIMLLVRSYTDNKIYPIDKRLIELADHLQDHFSVDTIEVISGYRSPEYNAKLKQEGHAVATESFHMQGLAMDIHIDEIDETVLRDYLLSLGLGGVGYYGQKLMVHMDFGPKRTWEDSTFLQNTSVGLFNTESAVVLKTQKFYYHDNETLRCDLQNLDQATQDNFSLQYFRRGDWQNVCDFLEPCKMKDFFKKQGDALLIDWQTFSNAAKNRHGKFRIRYDAHGEWQHSNEFYLKRK